MFFDSIIKIRNFPTAFPKISENPHMFVKFLGILLFYNKCDRE